MRKVPFETGADPAARPFAPDLSLESRQWKRIIRSDHVHRGPLSDPRTTCLPVVCPSRRLRFGTGYPEGYSRRIATLDVRRDSHPSSIHAWFRPGEARKRLPCGKLKRRRREPSGDLPSFGFLDLTGFCFTRR